MSAGRNVFRGGLTAAESTGTLPDLFDAGLLAQMLGEGYVREQRHPSEPLRILNYTAAAQYDRVWNEVTRACRGLIVHDDGAIVARPWAKFHNYSEHEPGTLDLVERCEVTDKLDGSLGILYPAAGSFAIATRGSFTSEQSRVATSMLRERYTGWDPEPGLTYLFEIIYPENRIVVDYGGSSGLYLLGAVQTATGRTLPQGSVGWPGPRAAIVQARTLAEALSLPPRKNAEGVVVRMLTSGLMVKIKQDDYVALHKLVTGLNERTVWEILAGGGTADGLIGEIPDEFHPWVREVSNRLLVDFATARATAECEHDEIVSSLDDGWTRKDYALVAARSARADLLFQLLDKKDPSAAIWRDLRPGPNLTLLMVSEDTA